MEPFYKTVLRTPSEYSCTNVSYKRKLPEMQDKHFLSHFESRGRECFFKKNEARLLNKTVSEI